MITFMQVLAVAALVLTSSVLSQEKDGVDSSNPSHKTKIESQPQKPKPKVNTLKGEVEVKPDHVDEMNEMISQYILTFDIKKYELKNENLIRVADTIKLLISQSWIRTLRPDPDLVTLVGTDRETLTMTIQDKLKQDNIKLPIVDAIITYKTDIEPKFTEFFEKKRKHLENADEIYKKHIKKAADAKNEIDADHLKSSWKGVFYTLNQINGNLVVHRMAHRMYIQSYLLNFVPETERPSEKITLIATDKKRSNKFRVPSMNGMDIFSDILLGDPEEVDKIILNGRISRYLKFFEGERKTVSDDELKKSMDVVKHLIVQGWIEKLNPPSQFLPSEDNNKNKDAIKNELLELNKNNPVKDAILLYTKDKEKSIENNFKGQQTSLKKNYDKIHEQIIDVPSHQQTEELNKLENELNELQDHLLAHKIAKLFYLHSYQDNFATEKSETLEIKSSKGVETKSFKVPPIDLMGFYERPMFD